MNDSSDRGWDVDFGADEVREVWDGDVRPVPAELLAPTVSPATRRFLTEVGLPTVEEYGIEFAHDERLASTVHRNGRELLPITPSDATFHFVVDVHTDQVFQVLWHIADDIAFWNSNVGAMVFFLGLLRKKVILPLQGADQDVVEDAIEAVRDEMEARDPEAMEATGTGWNSMLDEGYAV